MDQLELAVQYLKRRAVSTEKVKNRFIRQLVAVCPVAEVEAVLEMVKNGEFINFYNTMKEQGHKDCI